MLPAMLVGPSAAGILLARLANGRPGAQDISRRMRRVSLPGRLYMLLMIKRFMIPPFRGLTAPAIPAQNRS